MQEQEIISKEKEEDNLNSQQQFSPKRNKLPLNPTETPSPEQLEFDFIVQYDDDIKNLLQKT